MSDTVFGNLNVREKVLINCLKEKSFVVDYLFKEPIKKAYIKGIESTLDYRVSSYNIHDGPAIRISLIDLKGVRRELNEKVTEKDIKKVDYNGYFIEGVILSGSSSEMDKFKPILEDILNNPKNKYVGCWLD